MMSIVKIGQMSAEGDGNIVRYNMRDISDDCDKEINSVG